MPTDTFLKLPQEKKDKIILAAKKEFSRVSFSETSIKNIVEEAEIARGSFYQYFTSKEDVLLYLIHSQFSYVKNFMEEQLKKTNGDIFYTFIALYDYIVEKCFKEDEKEFYQKIFEDMKAGEDLLSSLPKKKCIPKDFSIYEDLVDTSILKIHEKEEVRLIIQLLSTIVRKSILSNFMYEDKEKARQDYIKQINYLKYGILKENEGGHIC